MSAGSNAYNSLWQVRNDAWSTLEESTTQLALAGAQQRPVEQLTNAVAEALDVLAPMERFWAFPGMQAFYKVRRLFATGKYDRCATLVARINRLLVPAHCTGWRAQHALAARFPSAFIPNSVGTSFQL